MDASIPTSSADNENPDSMAYEESEQQIAGARAPSQIPRLQSVLESIASQPDGDIPEQPSVTFPQAPIGTLPSSEIAENMSDSQSVDNRPLNVTDALSYLDAVKKQFEDKPDVYNDFLDIMKDFKSQKIDTPGVIDRVSQLFHGHNDLIQGFNTFLPPGYRIECSQDPLESNVITVTTPSGTMTQSTTEHRPPGRHVPPPLAPPIAPHAVVSGNMPSVSRPETPVQLASSPMPYTTSTSSAATWLGGLGNKGNAPERQGQGPAGAEEFHHAIQYVNKIKTRFEDDPDTYKQFLDILHAYRKEQNHDDSQVYAQVYAQVQVLFKDAPDLLAEFKDFLPATGGGSFAGRPPSPAANDAVVQDTEKRPAKTESVAAKRKRRPADKDQMVPQNVSAPPKLAGNSRSKKTKHNHAKADAASASPYHSQSRPVSPSHSHPPGHISHSQQSAHDHHQLAGSSLSQLSVSQPGSSSGPQDELAFFDKAKKALEASHAYDEFLKLLNLFSKGIIDAQTLIQRAEAFIDGDLYSQFKDLMGWDDKREGDNEGPPGSIRNWAADWANKPPPEKEERYGKSYRRLPLAETKLACSGRDELCWTVLNDVWVSHPTWASEESGFVSHKKNSYEEALHKSEEERHEFQFYIDIITRTIALLQPLYDRVLEMSPEEKNALRLPPDFGGSSKSIYYRAIKKVYGRDAHGMEVLQALQECPAVAIPVVLPRLKQKNEEWRRAQREWNRVWREVDARNFYKSLDHQGITFKANDKKYITTKSFVGEIENAKNEIVERVLKLKAAQARSKKDTLRMQEDVDKDCPSTSGMEVDMQDIYDAESAPHLEFCFSDLSVLQDAMKLVFSFLDRSTIQYSSHERRTVERMLRSFVPLLLMLTTSEFDSAFGPPLESDATDNEDLIHDDAAGGGASADETDEPHHGTKKSGGTSGRRSAGGSSASGSHGHGGVHPSDLRKKLLKTAQEKATKAAKSGSASASRAVSPAGSDDEHSKRSHARGASPSPTPKRKKGNRAKEKEDVHRVEWEEWVKLMPVAYDINKGSDTNDGMEVDSQEGVVERLAKQGLVDAKPFFMNTTFYALLRLLQLLYSRLLLCKEIGQRLATHERKSSVFTVNPVAEELGLVDAHGPGAVLALAANVPTHPPAPVSDTVTHDLSDATIRFDDRPEAHFYGYLLDACEKLFEGEFDQTTFEENMRYLFGTKAYSVFTLDKVIAALIKQVQTVVVDSKCQELLALLSKVRGKPGSLTMRELIAYRREAEQYLGQDDHLYRVDCVQGHVSGRVMRIWLLGSADPSADINSVSNGQANLENAEGHRQTRNPKGTAVARWRAYMESYVLSSPTELVDLNGHLKGKLQRTFLNRTREESDEDAAGSSRPERCVVSRGLDVGVQPGTYKLLYRNGSGDALWRWRTKEEEAVISTRAVAQSEERIRKMANIGLGQ